MGDFDTLDKFIPLDPNVPSVSYQAREQVPVFIPWTRKCLPLGAGLDIPSVSRPGDVGNLSLRPSAFDSKMNHVSLVFEPANATTSFRQTESSSTASSYDHMDASFGVSASCGFIGVSVQGEFAKSVSENQDSNKVSQRASLRVGRIGFSAFPGLSPESLSLLHKSPSDFNRKYGQYFAAALFIGADTTTFLSTSSSVDLHAEMENIEVKAKILWKHVNVYSNHSHSESASSTYGITYDGFDTLSAYQHHLRATDAAGYAALETEAERNLLNGKCLVERVKGALKSLGLDENRTTVVAEKQLEGVFNSGAVAEVMFLPYAGLRDYAAATATRSLASQLEKELQ
ncbi:hypothetical protein MSAN_01953900 [Mycena sanguinolenta]|uniref:MACPF domain-containing protein n=1 Tax=Mycena sanguinolenta TaxID=230812 RepID=A0A8H6XM16_9AGAR|nr:hypothetical protein MSAN_01953900 [Mycena sanguinolenta]